MSTLRALVKKGGISFARDAEALGCLLHEILSLFTESTKSVPVEIVVRSAVSLGYRGSAASVKRLLVVKGFVSNGTREDELCLHEGNRAAIDHFFITHEECFQSKRLNEREKNHLFETLGFGGTYADDSLLRVMRFLSAILSELRALPTIETDNLLNIAELEAKNFLLLEHVEWCKEHVQMVSQKLDETQNAFGMESREFRKMLKQYCKVYNQFDEVIDDAIAKNDLLERTLRDVEVIALLKSLKGFLLRFTSAFLKMEEESLKG